MPMERQNRRVVRFGVFEADLLTRELRKRGARVRLQEQPFRLLQALLERPGQIVTREEIKEKLWPDDTFVDFDKSLNTAAQKLRQALGDSAESPRFMETIPRQGYRFLAPIGSVGEQPTPESGESSALASPNEPRLKKALIAVSALAVILGIALLGPMFVQLTVPEPERLARRFSFVPPPNINYQRVFGGLAISPNGMHIAYTTLGASGGLWVQDLDRDQPRQLAGTEGAYLPFWSPDSQFIAFGASGELRKISVHGGDTGLICPLPGPAFIQGTWSPTAESMLFSAGTSGHASLYEVSSQGGSPEVLLTASELDEAAIVGNAVSRPSFLPREAGRALVFTFGSANASTLYARNLNTGQTESLGLGDRPVYSASTGHLIYQSERGVYNLWARPFSPQTLQFTGPAFPLRQNARQPSLSQDGTLVYLDGIGVIPAETLVWRNRVGELLETVGQPQLGIRELALSPDGQRVAVTSAESGHSEIWIHDLVRSTKTRLTSDQARDGRPTWSPSGREITYRSEHERGWSLVSKAADGTGEPVVLVESEYILLSPYWSRDGRYLVYHQRGAETGSHDLRYVQIELAGSASEPVTFLGSPASERTPKLSPDGRFVAYSSDESGRDEIYVRPFPDGAARWPACANGGRQAPCRSHR